LHSARIDRIAQSLTTAAGFPELGAPMSVLASPGVDVEVFAYDRVV
jgi:hypothetical protein